MATAGQFAGRIAEIAISSDGITYTAVEDMFNGSFSFTKDRADTSANDSGGSKTHIETWDDATASFSMYADESHTGQELVWTAALGKTAYYWRIRPRGDNSGDKQIIFQGTADITQSANKSEANTVNVTIQKTAAATRSNQ